MLTKGRDDGTEAEAAAAAAWVGLALDADRLLVLHDARHEEAGCATLLLMILTCIVLVSRPGLCLIASSFGEMRQPYLVSKGTAVARRSRRRDGCAPGGPPLDPNVRAASYARFSSALQNESSIVDQQRKCHEKTAVNGHAILPELEFSDEAVSGTKRDRTGLNAMLAAAEAGEFNVLYFHSLSRLSREALASVSGVRRFVALQRENRYNEGRLILDRMSVRTWFGCSQ